MTEIAGISYVYPDAVFECVDNQDEDEDPTTPNDYELYRKGLPKVEQL